MPRAKKISGSLTEKKTKKKIKPLTKTPSKVTVKKSTEKTSSKSVKKIKSKPVVKPWKKPVIKSEQEPKLEPKQELKTEIKTETVAAAPLVNPAPANIEIPKKARPVVIDVIEDEKENNFPELPKSNDLNLNTKPETITTQPESSIAQPEAAMAGMGTELPTEIDQQKKFFSQLVTEIKDKQPKFSSQPINGGVVPKEVERPHVQKSVNLYRRLVWRFVVLTIVLLVVVFYFSFSKLDITIIPNGEVINDNILLKIQSAGAASSTPNSDTDFREAVSGNVEERVVSKTENFSATGEEYVGAEITGKVTIINTTAKNQPLVATTRILSPDNKLFRIKNAVNVPAGGEVSADIYADKPSEDLAISATNFTIPGLAVALQDKIYAKSTEEFVYSQKVNKFIKASDIDQATQEMSNTLVDKAKSDQPATNTREEVLYETSDTATIQTDAKAGDSKDGFMATASQTVEVITFSKDEVEKLAAAKLALLVPDDKELANYDPNAITYSFDSYDAQTKSATVKASFSGTMVLKSNTDIIDKKQLVNLNRQQLEKYLKSFPEVKSFELKFFPSFITRSPRLPERISINIKGLDK